MNKVERDLNFLQYSADIYEVLNICKAWRDKLNGKENKELDKLWKAMINISVYVNALRLERESFDNILTEQREAVLRAVQRARKAEKEVQKMIKEM